MLFTDADPVTSAQLTAKDPEVPKIATAQGITLDGPNSVIRDAMLDAGGWLLSMFQNFGGYLVGFGQSANHAAAVNNIGNTSISRPRMALSQVVVVDPNPAKTYMSLWLQAYALFMIYRAASVRVSGKGEIDRMETKRKMWQSEMLRLQAQVTRLGVPVIITPLIAPGAIREAGVGTWANSNVTAAGSGSGDPGGTWYVAVTWVTLPTWISATNPQNGESNPSAAVTCTTTNGQHLTVSIASLNPPGTYVPNIGTSDIFYTYAAADHWNIYAGPSATSLTLQNASPLPIATNSYTFPTAPTSNGALAGNGQYAEFNFAWAPMIQRM